jgi:CheY-like chemotaxis protein
MDCVDGRAGRSNDRSTATILFVDEDAAVRRVAQHGLTRKGYRVLVADSGARALEVLLLYPTKIDVVISNAVIPRIEGATRCLFTSARLGDAAVSALRSRPGTAHLAKPWTIAELVEAISALLAPVSPAVGLKDRTRH